MATGEPRRGRGPIIAIIVGAVAVLLLMVVLGGLLTLRGCSWMHHGPMHSGRGRGGSGGMMEGYCPMCGQSWDGAERSYDIVPDELPVPQNQEWITNLEQVLKLEKLSQNQYAKDSRTYEAQMPYHMVIPQERNHIAWIASLFAAYGISAGVETPPTEDTESLAAAYELARQLESDLIPKYEWLIDRAEDRQSASVLDTILLQTRMHQIMFSHALRMGGMMGQGMMGRP